MIINSKNKINAAVIILAARKNIFKKTLSLFYKNWNYKYDYPVHVHTFGKIFSDNEIKQYNSEISKNIYFHIIHPQIPAHIKQKELFFNRTYIPYVKKYFPKSRIGYLHMCYFASNITAYGKQGCVVKEISNYDYLMRIDDDSWFKKKINFDLFKILKNYSMATGALDYYKNPKGTRENLLKFYYSYIKKKKIIPKNKILKKGFINNEKNVFDKLKWSAGNFDLYNLKKINTPKWKSFIDSINKYGGQYKHRWADFEIFSLYVMTYFKKGIYNFNFEKNGIYSPNFQNSAETIYSDSIINIHNNSYIYLTYKSILKIKNYLLRKVRLL
jgi:hypothetical protein